MRPHRRWPTLTLSLCALIGLCSPARAHRLEADYRILPGGKIQVESWFDLTGESPTGAQVRVYRKTAADVLVEGKLDKNGTFVFSYAQPELLRVVISAAGGHRKELEIPARELTAADAASLPSRTSETSVDTKPFADRSSRISPKDVLLGLALLLALAAFAMALGNARKLRELRQKLGERREE
jgi:hypothetical protein